MQQLARDEDGDLWELDAQGNHVRMVQSAASQPKGRVFSLAPNPKEVRQEARQQNRDAQTDADRKADNNRADRALALQEANAELQRQLTQLKIEEARGKGGGNQRAGALRSLVGQINRVQELFKAGPGSTDGLGSVQDYLPTSANKAFDAAGASLSQQGLAAFRVPGTGTVSDRDAIMFDKANLPQASAFDSATAEQLRGLRARVEEEYRTLGIGAPKWEFLEDAQAGKAEQKADNEAPNPTNNADLKPPPNYGSDDEVPPNGGGNPELPTDGQRLVRDPRVASMVDSLINAGASEGTINAALKQRNFPAVSSGDLRQARQWMKQNPGKKYYGADPTRPEDLSLWQETLANPMIAPVAAGLANYANTAAAGIPAALAGPEAQGNLEAATEMNPGSSMAGNIAGGVTGAIGAELALARAAPAALAKFAPRIANTLYGGLTGFNQAQEGEGLEGALWGAGAGLGGGFLGSKIGQGVSRIGAPRSGYLSPADKSISGLVKGDFGAVRPQLDEAQRLNMPFALADADPRLRSLGGAVTRKSVDARDMAERILEPRSLGQADRAIDAIDTHLAPVTDIGARGAQHIDNARLNSNPLYAAAKARDTPIDAEVTAMLQSPAGQDALRRAQIIAANEGRDPNTLGFIADENGIISLDQIPSFETLDMVKRGFDARLAEAKNPVTGQIDFSGNPELGAIEGLRQRFVGRLDELNEVYPQARAAYAAEAAKKDALDRGYKAPQSALPTRDLNRVLGSLKPDQLPEYQRGYATSLADTVERTRMTANPYASIFGSTSQREKLGSVFPDGFPDFAQVDDLERAMGKTRHEVLGGSPTAGRLQADEQLNGGLGTTALDFGSQLATGGGFSLGSALNAGRRMLGDSIKLGIGKKAVQRADEIAPILFETNPQIASEYLDDLLARMASRAARSKSAGEIGGRLGAGILTPLSVGP